MHCHCALPLCNSLPLSRELLDTLHTLSHPFSQPSSHRFATIHTRFKNHSHPCSQPFTPVLTTIHAYFHNHSQTFTLYHFLFNLESVSVKCFDLTKFLMICRAKKSSKWLEAPLVAKLPRFGDSVPWRFQNLYMKLKHRQLSRYFLLTCYLRFPLFRSIFSKE